MCLINDRNSWKASLNMAVSRKFCKREFLLVNHVKYLFMVGMRWLVLNLGMSQVTVVTEKENQEPMTDQVITVESELILCLFVEGCSHVTDIQNFWLLW